MAEHIGVSLVHILAAAKDQADDQAKPLAEREGMARTVLQFGIDRLPDQNHQADVAAAYEVGEKLCESPIERVTLAGLLTHDWQVPSTPPLLHDPTNDQAMPVAANGLVIVPQARFLRHRLDFALVAEWDGTQHIVAIECDGLEFHRGIADSERDLYLASWGIPSFRLSGKAITRDIHQAITPIKNAILEWRMQALKDLRMVACDVAQKRLGWL